MAPQEGEDMGGHFGHTICIRQWYRDVTLLHQTTYTSRVDGGCNVIDFLCGMDARNGVVTRFTDTACHDDRKDKNDGSENDLAANGVAGKQ